MRAPSSYTTIGLLAASLCMVGTAQGGSREGVRVPVTDDVAPLPEVGLDFVQALIKSMAVIVVTELGDKTFFIAAVRPLPLARDIFSSPLSMWFD